jgi:hypothetical protein
MNGKAALDNPDLPIDFVSDLLIAKREGQSLATPYSTKQALMASKPIQVTQSSAFSRLRRLPHWLGLRLALV